MLNNRQKLADEREARILAVEAGSGWPSEDIMQSEYFQWAHNLYPESRFLLFHVPNGGSRNRIEGMKLKAMGVCAGIPDLILINPANMVVHGIELKPRGKGQSDVQKECQSTWTNNYTLIVEDFEAFKRLVQEAFGDP